MHHISFRKKSSPREVKVDSLREKQSQLYDKLFANSSRSSANLINVEKQSDYRTKQSIRSKSSLNKYAKRTPRLNSSSISRETIAVKSRNKFKKFVNINTVKQLNLSKSEQSERVYMKRANSITHN